MDLNDPLNFAHGPAMANRMMLAPLTNLQSHADGTLSDDEYEFVVQRAAGGFGLVMTCAAHVQRCGQGFPGQLGIWSDDHLPGLSRLAAGINARGSLSSVQLQHSGHRANPSLSGTEAVCPWHDADSGARAMTTGEVEQVIEDFILAAQRAEKAGFHGIELHGAHGYLLGQFLDGEKNLRSDGYGGSLEGRQRVLFTIAEGIRNRCGKDFQIGLRLSPERYGITIAEARETAARAMADGTIDYLDMSLWSVFKEPDEAAHAGTRLIDHFTDLPRGICRLGVAGKIMSGETARACLAAGADFVLIGRGAILHHDFARRALDDPGFVAASTPVTRDYLRAEFLGERFVKYMAANWRGFVTDSAEA